MSNLYDLLAPFLLRQLAREDASDRGRHVSDEDDAMPWRPDALHVGARVGPSTPSRPDGHRTIEPRGAALVAE